jgi:hypothetical protein
VIALTSRQRALLLFLSASAYIAWFAGLGDRTEAQGIGVTRGPSVTIDARPSLPSVASIIVRDPFSGKPEPRTAQRQSSQLAISNVPRSDSGIDVPDIDARSAPAVASTTLVLRATIVGPQPVAYVANGSAMDIVRVGDTLGDRRVAKIELRGIAFDDGTRLDLPESYVSTPSPKRPAAPNGDRITLHTLQQLLSSREPSGNAAEPRENRATPQAAASSEAASYPTPGPLPTVNMQGLPVGVNPTDNPSAPTPYAYPYPYAPRGPH